MELRYLLFCFLLSKLICGQTYQYTAFPQEHGRWGYVEYSDNWIATGFTEVIYRRDSITGLMGNTVDGYFEHNKRVFFLSGSDTTLMYDFNLTLGDTIIADAVFGRDTFYVVSDDSTGYYGRRQITLMSNSQFYLPTVWVEGIGNVSGIGTLWENFSAWSISGGYGFLCLYSDSLTFPCNSFLSQMLPTQMVELELYPNPNQGTFQVKSDILQEHTIRVFNSYGQCVFSELRPSGGVPTKIQLQDAEAGLYFIELRNSNIVRTHKFIVN